MWTMKKLPGATAPILGACRITELKWKGSGLRLQSLTVALAPEQALVAALLVALALGDGVRDNREPHLNPMYLVIVEGRANRGLNQRVERVHRRVKASRMVEEAALPIDSDKARDNFRQAIDLPRSKMRMGMDLSRSKAWRKKRTSVRERQHREGYRRRIRFVTSHQRSLVEKCLSRCENHQQEAHLGPSRDYCRTVVEGNLWQ